MARFTMRQLGKTGIQVSPIGIGGGSGIESDDVLYAFEKGINYFFFSSDLHHWKYQRSAQALRTLCSRGSSAREQVVLATVSYLNDPTKVIGLLLDQFAELQIDYIDVFHWGWVTDTTPLGSMLEIAREMQNGGSITQHFWSLVYQAQTINEELLKRGLVRYVGSSFHSRAMARTYMNDLDVLMLRYNIAHTGAEQDIVPFLAGEKTRDPGVVVFNTAHEGGRHFHTPVPGYTPGAYVPTASDSYRFALSQPWVDLVLTGPQNRQQIDASLAAVAQGPLSDYEDAVIRTYGEQILTHS